MFNTLKGLARIKANDWKQTKYELSWEGRPAVLCQRRTNGERNVWVRGN